MTHGLRIIYLPVNQAYAIIWGTEHLLGIYNTREEAQAWFDDWTR